MLGEALLAMLELALFDWRENDDDED